MTLAPLIDHTLLDPLSSLEDIHRLSQDAITHGFAAVCVLPNRVGVVLDYLKAHDPKRQVKLCTVVGFPLGANALTVKLMEASQAIEQGADEIDYVVDLTAVKEGRMRDVEKEMAGMRLVCQHVVLKAIFETAVLTDEQIIQLSEMAQRQGLDFVKTSTGYTHDGASVKAVALMRAHTSPDMGIKASGGIRAMETARVLLAAGATRLGTSRGLALIGVQANSNPVQNTVY